MGPLCVFIKEKWPQGSQHEEKTKTGTRRVGFSFGRKFSSSDATRPSRRKELGAIIVSLTVSGPVGGMLSSATFLNTG